MLAAMLVIQDPGSPGNKAPLYQSQLEEEHTPRQAELTKELMSKLAVIRANQEEKAKDEKDLRKELKENKKNAAEQVKAQEKFVAKNNASVASITRLETENDTLKADVQSQLEKLTKLKNLKDGPRYEDLLVQIKTARLEG
jgi:hypothetical protein